MAENTLYVLPSEATSKEEERDEFVKWAEYFLSWQAVLCLS
jgi:hypothetical protein